MGRVGRWLKDLLICRRHCANSSSSRHHNHSTTNGEAEAAAAGEDDERRESWRFACRSKSIRRYEQAAAASTSAAAEDDDSAWTRSFRGEDDKEQREHAVAVAEATAAAADAAMVAARAAVALVRLTSQLGTAAAAAAGTVGQEWRAAVKIQSAFRCHLAMKALRALRALVKMQAMVRGYLVRKQTALTFKSMQALMRAQAIMHSIRSPDHASLIPPSSCHALTRTAAAWGVSKHSPPTNYMLGTQSFNTKFRCHSTPMQAEEA